jgi:mono/diheme cytochrome c family protein
VVTVALTALVAVGCATLEVPHAHEADVHSARAAWPGTTLADLQRGRELYLARCTGCHQPILPHQFSAKEWPAHVAEMRERAHLASSEADLMVRFLVTMADAPSNPVRPHDVARDDSPAKN